MATPKKRNDKHVERFIHQEDTITLNEHVPKSRASKYMKRKMTDLEGKTDKPTSMVGDFKASC